MMTVSRISGSDAETLSHDVARSMPLVHAKVTHQPLLLLYSGNDNITTPNEVISYAPGRW